MTRPTPARRCAAAAALAVAAALATPALAADALWVPTGAGNYLVDANWSTGQVPGSVDATDYAIVNNGGTANLADNAFQLFGVEVGAATGTSGTLNHSAGLLPLLGPGGDPVVNSRGVTVGGFGGTGTYALSGTANVDKGQFTGDTAVGYRGGTGTMTVADSAIYFSNWGRFSIGAGLGSVGNLAISGTGVVRNEFVSAIGGSNGTGTLTMSGNAVFRQNNNSEFTVAYANFSDPQGLPVGDPALPTSGTVTMTGNSLVTDFSAAGTTTAREMWVGQGVGATGTMTLGDDARVTFGNWMVIGRQGGTGSVTLNDRAVYEKVNGFAGRMIVGADANSTGTLTLNDTTRAESSGEFWVGEAGGNGTLVVNEDADVVSNDWMVVARNGGTGVATLNNNASMTKNGGGVFIVSDNGASGTLNLNDQSSAFSNGEFWVGQGASTSTGLVNLNGSSTLTTTNWIAVGRGDATGTMNVNGSAVVTKGQDGNFVIGAGATGTVNLNGGTINVSNGDLWVTEGASTGTLNVAGGAINIASGGMSVGRGGDANGTVTQTGGTVTITSPAAPGTGFRPGVAFGVAGNAATVGTYNLNGGTLVTPAIVHALEGDPAAPAPGTYRFNFNGGTLRASADNSAFMTLLNGEAQVLAGGAVIDTNGFQIGIPTQLQGVGGLTKNGAGVLTLGTAPKNTGALTVNGGSLVITSPAVSGDPASKITVSSVSIASGSSVSIGSNLLAVDYTGASPAAAIRAAIVSGALRAGDAAPPSNQALGYGEASAIDPDPAAFGTVDATTVLVRLTLKGDVNLSGNVSFPDLAVVALNYNTTGKVWTDGDFDYDGDVDFQDLAPLALNYNTALPSPLMVQQEFGVDFAGQWTLALAAAVPEPAALLGVAGAGVLTLARRRRA